MIEPARLRRLRRLRRFVAVACWASVAACASPDDTAAGGRLDAAPSAGHGDATSDAPTPDAAISVPASDTSGATRPVSLRFRAVVDGAPFACGTSYLDAAGVRFTPADLRAFVQDVSLLTADGAEQPVVLDVRPPWQEGTVALIDFEDGSGACAAGTRDVNAEVSGTVPLGDYRGLAFSNGVPEARNHADPATLPPPLQAGSMTWGWLLGYRFLMAEVVALPGDAGVAGSALLHVGSSGCSGNPGAGGIHCAKANRNRVRLADFDPDSDVVVIDLAPLFSGIDLSQVTTCHSSGPECAPFFERVGIDLPAGSASERQLVYHVEPLGEGAP